jgi:hypothetical protein
MIRSAGGRATVVALADEFSDADRSQLGKTPLLTARVKGPRAIGYAPDLAGLLDKAAPDILHLHGIWMYPSSAGERWAARTGKPYVSDYPYVSVAATASSQVQPDCCIGVLTMLSPASSCGSRAGFR